MNAQWPVGQQAEVRAQPKGGGAERVIGSVVIEDLTDVLDRISTRRGPSGPQSPVTQYILAQAAGTLLGRLKEDTVTTEERDSVPRVLSSLIGHEPFVETRLGLSVHHMRRRWPTAANWYADLVNYILRPSRFDAIAREAALHLPQWLGMSLGELARAFGDQQLRATQDDQLMRLAETIEALWPDYEPVRLAARRYQEAAHAMWAPVYESLMCTYRLRMREGVELRDFVWMFNSLVTQEARQRTVLPELSWCLDSIAGDTRSYTSRAAMIFVAGATVSLDGNAMTLEDLYARTPD
jgi:hypothetical protein